MPFPVLSFGGSMHICPMLTGIVPHVGGVITPTAPPKLMLMGMPALTVGAVTVCVGPPGTIVQGSPKCMVGGMPVAHLTSATAHGGVAMLMGPPKMMV